MKKILKSIAILAGICFFAGTAHAQLSSDKSSLTPQQASDLIKRKSNTPASTTYSAGLSSGAALTPAQAEALMQRAKAVGTAEKVAALSNQGGIKPENADASKASDQPALKLPAVSNQGGVTPILSSEATVVKPEVVEPAVKPTEVKAVALPSDQKTKS